MNETSDMRASDLDSLSRSDLISQAEALGVDKPSVLTRAELADEIVRRTVSDPAERRAARGLLGVARDLVARVVQRGLHLSDAAELLRTLRAQPGLSPIKPPIATVTLAEIYATQGHKARALAVLDAVLAKEPEHLVAQKLRDRVAAEVIDPPVLPPEAEDTSSTDVANDVAESTPAAEPVQAEVALVDAPSLDLPSSDSVPHAPPPSFAEQSLEFESHAHPSEPTNGQRSPSSHPPQGPVGMLDDAPLPELYDTSEIVLMPIDPKTVYVYWEIRQAMKDELEAAGEGGTLVLRLLAVSPRLEGPQVETRDVAIDHLVGDWFVRDLPVGAVLRAAIGFRRALHFEPLSVAMDVTSPTDAASPIAAGELAEYTSEGMRALDGVLSLEQERTKNAVLRARRRMSGEPRAAETSWSSMPTAALSLPHSWASSSDS